MNASLHIFAVTAGGGCPRWGNCPGGTNVWRNVSEGECRERNVLDSHTIEDEALQLYSERSGRTIFKQ